LLFFSIPKNVCKINAKFQLLARLIRIQFFGSIMRIVLSRQLNNPSILVKPVHKTYRNSKTAAHGPFVERDVYDIFYELTGEFGQNSIYIASQVKYPKMLCLTILWGLHLAAASKFRLHPPFPEKG